MSLRASVAHQTTFALRLAKHVVAAAAEEGSNLAFSPLSFHAALSLLAAGSKGETLDQLISFLAPGSEGASAADLAALSSHVVGTVLADASAAGGPCVSVANGVWVDSSLSLKPAFAEIAASAYKAETKSVDFGAKADEVVDQVNSWVDAATAGLIKLILPRGSIDEVTRLVLGNALYFKGAWTEKFDASETKDNEFHLLDGSSVQVPFMASWEDQFLSCYDDFKMLRLPYEQGKDKRQFSMYIFLPKARDGLWNLVDKLSSEPEFLDRLVPTKMVEVRVVEIPKFKISFGFEASKVLQSMGLNLPFVGSGGLTEMVDSPSDESLYVSSIFHKSVIEVDEKGTEAAAATIEFFEGCSLMRNSPPDFVADHPFFFLIREDTTGVVLFAGHVLNPSMAGNSDDPMSKCDGN